VWGHGGSGEIGSQPEFCRTPQGYDVWCSTVPFPVTDPAFTGIPQPTLTSLTLSPTTVVGGASATGTVTRQYSCTTASAQPTIDPPSQASDALTVKRAEYSASKRELRVEANSTLSGQTLAVYVTATNERVGTLTGHGTRYSGPLAWPSNPQSITIRSSGGGSVTTAVGLK
jgi:hypothetical protein